jgi:Berberine and berberine like
VPGDDGNYDRLVSIKSKYDPGNLFRMNNNIPPSVEGA